MTPLPQPELISHWGYPGETHTVQTEDGFYLEVHRITGGRGQFDKPGGRKKAPILLAHGYGATSECMVLREHDNLGEQPVQRRLGRALSILGLRSVRHRHSRTRFSRRGKP